MSSPHRHRLAILAALAAMVAQPTAGAAALVDSGLSYEDALAVDFPKPGCGIVGGSWRTAQTNGTTAVLSPTGYSTPMWDLRLFSGGHAYPADWTSGSGHGHRVWTTTDGDTGETLVHTNRMVGAADIPIDGQTLDAWRQTLANARANGALVSPRFAYDCNGVGGCEPAFDMVLHHMRQIAAVLNEYADVVPSIECGIVGAYGEMHTSDYCDAVHESQVLRTWLDELDPRIRLQVRSAHPLINLFRQEVLGGAPGNVYAADVLARLAEIDGWERIGLYNDGYLGTPYDYGTWTDARGINNFSRAQGNEWLARLPHIPYGGEFAGISEEWSYREPPFAAAGLVTNGFNQVEEWYQAHLTYLRGTPSGNHTVRRLSELPFSTAPFGFDGMESCGLSERPFFEAMVARHMGFGFAAMPDLHEWEGRSLLDFLRGHIGHRFVLRGSRLSPSAEPGGTLELSFDVENTGFCDLWLPAKSEILLQSSDDRFWACPVSLDLGAAVPSASRATFSVTLRLPSALAEGDWRVHLRTHVVAEGDSPSAAGLRTVRFANDASQWNAPLAANLLGTVSVAGTAAAPGLDFREAGSTESGATAPQLVLAALPADSALVVDAADWSGAELRVYAPGATDLRYLRDGREWPSTNGVAVLPEGDGALGAWAVSYAMGGATTVRDLLAVAVEPGSGHTWRLATRDGRLRAVCDHCGGERDPMPGFDRGLPGRATTSLPATNALLSFASSAHPFTADPACRVLYPAFSVSGVPDGGARLGDLYAVTAPPGSTSYLHSNSSGNLHDRNAAAYDPAQQTVALPADGAYLTDIGFWLVNWSSPSQYGTAREFSLNNPAATRGGRSAGLEDAELATLGLFTAIPGFHVWFCDEDWRVLCETNGVVATGFNGNFHAIPIPAAAGLFDGEPPAAFASTDERCRVRRGWKRLSGAAPGWALGDVALLPDYAESDHQWETAGEDDFGNVTRLRCAECGRERELPGLAGWFHVRFARDGYRPGPDWDDRDGSASGGGSWLRPAGDASFLAGSRDEGRILVVSSLAAPLRYTPSEPSSNGVDLVVKGRAAIHPLPSAASLPAATSGALAFVAASDEAAPEPWGNAADGWHRLHGAAPRAGDWAEWRMELDLSSSLAPRVRYRVDGGLLDDAADGAEWLPLDAGVTRVSAVEFLGSGLLGDFFGSYADALADDAGPDPGYVPARPVFGADGDAPALSFAVDPDTGAPRLVVRIANAERGLWYTAFTAESLDGAFAAEGDSRQAPADGAFAFDLDATPTAKFVIIVAGTEFHRDGDPLP